MNQKNNSKTADDWFRIGQDEFNFAKISFEELGSFYPQICFQFQQAVEKYLKGFLVYYNERFDRTHDLTQLLELCAKIDKDFLDYLDEVNYLGQFYFIARYPIVEYPPAGKKEALKALKYAESVIGLVKKKLNKIE